MKKISKAIREGGLSLLIKRCFRFIYRDLLRSLMPYRKGNYNSVVVPSFRLFEGVLDLNDTSLDRPDYEKGIIESLKENVEEGDSITIVGGGNGVSAVWAARLNDAPEKVNVYEASSEQCDLLRKTLEYNDMEEISLHNCVVGVEGELYGDRGNTKVIEPSDLDSCDVLEIDIEGAELEVLDELDIRPEVLIVESHGVYDAPTKKVKQKIRDIGYEVKSVREAETDEEIQEQDVKVITGKYGSE